MEGTSSTPTAHQTNKPEWDKIIRRQRRDCVCAFVCLEELEIQINHLEQRVRTFNQNQFEYNPLTESV